MTEILVAIVPLLLLVGYAKLQQGKERPLSSREGKRQFVIGVLLTLVILASGVWFSFAEGQSKREQYILSLIVISGTVAVFIGVAVALLRNKLERPKQKPTHQKHGK